MNKKLIAIAVAGALSPMAAQAAPTVYGHGQVEYATYGSDATGAAVIDNARGRVGIKNSEDLGNGMTALFKAEFKADFTDGVAGGTSTVDTSDAGDGSSTADVASDAALTKREMMVGIKAGFGTISAGRLKSPYKYTGGVNYDPYVTTVHEARGIVMAGKEGAGKGFGHNGFISDAVSYQNKFGPLNVWVLTQLDTGGPSADDGSTGTVVALAYKQGNIHAFVKSATDGVDGTGEYSATAFGAKMKFGSMDVAVQMEALDVGGNDVDTMFVNFNMKMGKNVFTANYGTAESGSSTGTKTTLAVAHKFSKKTRAWVGHTIVDNDPGETTVTSLGLRVDI
jgi:predicted porin